MFLLEQLACLDVSYESREFIPLLLSRFFLHSYLGRRNKVALFVIQQNIHDCIDLLLDVSHLHFQFLKVKMFQGIPYFARSRCCVVLSLCLRILMLLGIFPFGLLRLKSFIALLPFAMLLSPTELK